MTRLSVIVFDVRIGAWWLAREDVAKMKVSDWTQYQRRTAR